MFSKILVLGLMISTAHASYEEAVRTYGTGSIALSGHRRTVIELVKGGYYFSAVPWMKDYLVKSGANLDGDLEDAMDSMLAVTGVKIFESLPESVLQRSRSANIRYILAKRLFKKGKFQEALNEVKSVRDNHPAYPFVSNLMGVIESEMGNAKKAEEHFRDCIRSSKKMASDSDLAGQKNQYLTNRDYCVAGVARSEYVEKKYTQAELSYLDIPKDSFVWPEILFEEAWTSYHLKNYNRTLGKLISYKAPVFDFVFKPETEVLKAMTYMKMCLYEDAKKTTDDFYNNYLEASKELRSSLLSMGKNYRSYYNLMADMDANEGRRSQIIEQSLRSIKKDPAFIEMKGSLTAAVSEYNKLRKQNQSSLKANLLKNMQTVLDEYRSIIGSYVRAGMVSKYSELYTAFQGMSYIKLEVLAQRKDRLYQTEDVGSKKRGDVKYIQRNDKQYFWTFNGEFWADELGDYVFALRSEC